MALRGERPASAVLTLLDLALWQPNRGWTAWHWHFYSGSAAAYACVQAYEDNVISGSSGSMDDGSARLARIGEKEWPRTWR